MYDGILYRAGEAPGLHPKLNELLRLWTAKCDGRELPRRADLDVLELRPWIGNLVMIEVLETGRDFLYRIYGTALADYFGRDLTGRRLSTLPMDVQNVVRAEYQRVVSDSRPCAVTHRRSIQRVRAPVSKLILPLGPSAASVDHLLVGMYLAA